MRDALCDNEQEYRRFMAANPDVFDPDEKAKKPFAGLGPDVGQAAMLRLAAKHRGVRGGARPGTLGSGHRIHSAGRETPHVPHGA